MILLGFDTATPATAVALRVRGEEALEARDDPPAEQRPRHTSDLLMLAVRLMDEAGIGWSDLGGIAVGLGPGTFTGLRVGVATARGLAQSLGVRLRGVSSLRAIAAPALAQERQRGSPALAVLDARRGEAFLAAYEQREDEMVELIAPRAVRPEQLACALEELRASDARLTGSLAVGDGAILFRPQLTDAGATVPADDSPLHLLRASAVCEIAASDGAEHTIEQVLPLYGRRPDAEIAIEAASR